MGSTPADYGLLKSSTAVVKNFRTLLEDHLLDPDKATLSPSPTSFVNMIMAQMGEYVSVSHFEQQMYKREIEPSTAIKLRSLYRHIDSDTIGDVLGQAADMRYILGFPEKLLIANAVPTTNGDSRLRINKNIKMGIKEKPYFTLDHDIEIVVSTLTTGKTSIYAKFDLTGRNPSVSKVENPFILSKNNLIFNGESYFIMYLPMRQYSRTEYSFDFYNKNEPITIQFGDQILGFEMFYKADTTSAERLIYGAPDGERNEAGYSFAIDLRDDKLGGGGQIDFSFDKGPTSFTPMNGTIRIVIYTTLGTKGNFRLSNVEDDVKDLIVTMSQNRSDGYQEALTPLIPLISIRDSESANGKNAMTMEEIRTHIIAYNHTRGLIIAPGEIEQRAADLGFLAYKVRSDVRSLDFRLLGTIKNTDGVIIPTAMRDFKMKMKDVPLFGEVGARIIYPRNVFSYNQTDDVCNLMTSITPIRDYIKQFKSNQNHEYQFPFMLKVTTTSELSVEAFDTSANDSYPVEFEFFNDHSETKAATNELKVNRDPTSMDYISMTFAIETSDSVIDYYLHKAAGDTDIIIAKMVFKNIQGGDEFIADATLIRIDQVYNRLNYEVKLPTNDAISASQKLAIINSTIQPLPYVTTPINFYFLEGITKVTIAVMLKASGVRTATEYDYILTESLAAQNFYISTVYSVTEVSLFKSLSNYIRISPDIFITQPEYELYTVDVPDTYTETIYKLDANNQIEYEDYDVVNPSTGVGTTLRRPIALHEIGSYKVGADGNVIILHHKGTVILGPDNKPIVKTLPEQVLYLRAVPAYDRIFSFANYTDVVAEYRSALEEIASLGNRLAGGCTLSMGVRKTSSGSKYKFLNLRANRIEALDNNALSFSIGVKVGGNMFGTDADYLVDTIKSEIINYVNTWTGSVFSINTMLEELKKLIPNIDYFEFYGLNTYDAGVCQTIYVDAADLQNRFDEVLCIKYIVDESSIVDDVSNIKFIPDINIKVITK